MYCSTLPQKFLRCADSKCWAAARDDTEHVRGCSIRGACMPLGSNDAIHNVVMRFNLSTTNNTIERYVPVIKKIVKPQINLRTRSSIAEDIEFKWDSPKSFLICGPESMNFRVLIVVCRKIVARFDIGYRNTELLLFPIESQPNLEKCKEASKMNQTAAILTTSPNDTLEIETHDHLYRLVFSLVDVGDDDEYYELAQYSIESKSKTADSVED